MEERRQRRVHLRRLAVDLLKERSDLGLVNRLLARGRTAAGVPSSVEGGAVGVVLGAFEDGVHDSEDRRGARVT